MIFYGKNPFIPLPWPHVAVWVGLLLQYWSAGICEEFWFTPACRRWRIFTAKRRRASTGALYVSPSIPLWETPTLPLTLPWMYMHDRLLPQCGMFVHTSLCFCPHIAKKQKHNPHHWVSPFILMRRTAWRCEERRQSCKTRGWAGGTLIVQKGIEQSTKRSDHPLWLRNPREWSLCTARDLVHDTSDHS